MISKQAAEVIDAMLTRGVQEWEAQWMCQDIGRVVALKASVGQLRYPEWRKFLPTLAPHWFATRKDVFFGLSKGVQPR